MRTNTRMLLDMPGSPIPEGVYPLRVPYPWAQMKLRHTFVVSEYMTPNIIVSGFDHEKACMPSFGNAKSAVAWPNRMVLSSAISFKMTSNSSRAAPPTNTTSPTSGLRSSSLMASWPPASATICDAAG